MSSQDRTERLERAVTQGFAAIENDDLDAAGTALATCKRIDRHHPDVVALDATVAHLSGDFERALSLWEEVIDQRPEDPAPRLFAAQLCLEDLDDPEGCLEHAKAALEHVDEESGLLQAIELTVNAHLALANAADEPAPHLEAARTALREVATSAIDDAHDLVDLGLMAIDAEAYDLAKTWLTAASVDKAVEADALFALGRLAHREGDAQGALTLWLRGRAIEAASTDYSRETMADPAHPDVAELALPKLIQTLAKEAINELPPRARDHLQLSVTDVPTEAHMLEGVESRAYGYFEAGEPARLHLFALNLGRAATDAEQLKEEVELTVVHETNGHFDYTDDELASLGFAP